MKKNQSDQQHESIDRQRRRLLGAAGTGIAASTVAGVLGSGSAAAAASKTLRWGVVGTGSIANSMARMIKLADSAELAAVSSRRMESAKAFAERHGAGNAFDSWAEMAVSDVVDAIYVATPTSVREEICVAAANAGKHVLGEKPFATFDSVRRITAACRLNGVGFMDGTHFPHHPRTGHIQSQMADETGRPWSVASAFQFNLTDRANIRFNPELEPYGAIGDTGWYNMRAAVEYLATDVELVSADAHLRRDAETGAAISGSGVLVFNDGSTSTWNCGFDSGAVVMDLRITGPKGVISIDNFLSQDPDGSASYLHRQGGWGPNAVRRSATIASDKPGSARMFEDFAAMVGDTESIEASMLASERTMALLDASWESALANET
nr:Gfo/Idh/MocA family oxidoreductase [Woeseiaceae bacterium]